jgi:hypothetical protein
MFDRYTHKKQNNIELVYFHSQNGFINNFKKSETKGKRVENTYLGIG